MSDWIIAIPTVQLANGVAQFAATPPHSVAGPDKYRPPDIWLHVLSILSHNSIVVYTCDILLMRP
ncbi:uncharacterized protein TrAtP1_011218 [Trichoderma atroviride]|uniref:uncharacterized protein n=1 Tax=Hypocrea atroviridis TaxID=63577 RepID=UPI0033197211|nr:hypothetical protein TrAtP1_011218 [Trichoderma atroviride]